MIGKNSVGLSHPAFCLGFWQAVPSHPMARFWAFPVVPLSQDNEGTSVPLSQKNALSCPVGNPSEWLRYLPVQLDAILKIWFTLYERYCQTVSANSIQISFCTNAISSICWKSDSIHLWPTSGRNTVKTFMFRSSHFSFFFFFFFWQRIYEKTIIFFFFFLHFAFQDILVVI